MVMVISGREKGKTGRVMRVLTAESRAVVEHVNLVKKAKRRSQQDPNGGIIEIEASIHLSNLMLLDKQSNQPVRFKISVGKDGSKTRLSKKSGAVI